MPDTEPVLYTAFGVCTTLRYTVQRGGAKGAWVTVINTTSVTECCEVGDALIDAGRKRVRIIDNAERVIAAGTGAKKC